MLLLFITLIVSIGGAFEGNGVNPALVHKSVSVQIANGRLYLQSLQPAAQRHPERGELPTQNASWMLSNNEMCYNECDDLVDLGLKEICNRQ